MCAFEHIVLELRAPTIQGIGHITSSSPSAKGHQVKKNIKNTSSIQLFAISAWTSGWEIPVAGLRMRYSQVVIQIERLRGREI